MKRILVPTDFSAFAGYGMKAALDLAQKFGARVSALHVVENENSKAEREQKIHNAEILFSEWTQRAKEKGVDFDFNILEGKFLPKLTDTVKEYNPDFIIIGSHGTSGKREFFIGSNAQKAIRMIPRPFLIVKSELSDVEFNKVVFASSFNESEKDPFKYFLSFIERFNPEIHLVAINTYSWFSQPFVILNESMKDFKNMARRFQTELHFVTDLSIEAGIRHFSERINADLVVISNHEKHPLKRIFSGSNVEALVNHSKQAILSIDYPK